MRDTTESGSVVVKSASGRRMNVKKLRPLDDTLVVDNNVRLRKKRGETLGDVELFGALPSVVLVNKVRYQSLGIRTVEFQKTA